MIFAAQVQLKERYSRVQNQSEFQSPQPKRVEEGGLGNYCLWREVVCGRRDYAVFPT
jgi:hypothetical protein